MNEFNVWLRGAEPPPAPRLKLPRLQIIHLMMWMAATAAAFVPYRVQQESLKRMSAGSAEVREAPAAMAMSVGYGVLQGAFLFVTAAVLWWRRRGYKELLQPGHCLAYQGAFYWSLSVIAWALISLNDGQSSRWYYLYSISYFIAGLVFLVWFLRLARRRDVQPSWRRAFAVVAVAPVIGWVLMMCSAMFAFGSPRSFVRTFALTQGSTTAIVAVALATAMRADRRGGVARHWSHWIGAGARFAEAAGMCLYYLAVWLSPPSFGGF
jgi:hypothetical protein